MQIKKERKSKYPFSRWEVGDNFVCKDTDYNSMLTSLRQYNGRANTSIEITAEERPKKKLLITRTK